MTSASLSRSGASATAALVALVAVLAGLLVGLPGAASAAESPADELVLRYEFDQTTGTTVTDSSGNGREGTIMGGAAWDAAGGLTFDGADDYVKLPNDLLSGLSSVTVSTEVYVEPSQPAPYFIWGIGNPSTSDSGTGYLFASGNTLRAGPTATNWRGEQLANTGANLQRGVWKTLTYTQTGSTGTLYEDGTQVAQRTDITVTPGAIGGGTTTSNAIGKSTYASDNRLKGTVRDFRIYDRALTPGEVASLVPSDADRVAADTAALSLGDLSAVTDDLTLPVKGARGSTIAWTSSKPAVIAANGTVTRPAAGEPDVDVELTATLTIGGASDAKSFTATVKAEDSDQAKADAAAAAIEITDVDDVRGNITLPTRGAGGATIAWTSSNPSVITANGVVTRPAHGSAAAAVRLTAVATVGDATATREIDATVRPKPKVEPYAGYAMSYFTAADESIFFAASRGNNALQWDELNGGKPTLTSTKGTTGVRDPFLIRSPEGDKFFLIATDLDIEATDWGTAQRNGSKYLEVWESTDLVTWSEQRHVRVSPDTAGNTWAPEAYWSDELGSYVVFWASPMFDKDDVEHTGNTYQKMFYATTRDFRTFSEPRVWQDFGSSRIDSTVIKDGDTYHRFTKDEGGVTKCSDIIQEKSDDLLAVDDASQPGWSSANPAWKIVDSCIGRKAGTSAVEGPTAFKANPGDTSGSKYYLFADEYGGRGYVPLGTDDLDAPDWKIPATYKLPGSPRHGTVIPVTAAELDALRDDPAPATADENGLIARYRMDQSSGSTVVDSSGNGHDATVSGDTSWTGDSLVLGGDNGHVKLPDDLMAGLDEITVSTQVRIDAKQQTPYFIWGLGNTSSSGAGNGYLFTGGDDRYRTSIASGSWQTEQTARDDAALPRGVWKTLTYTLRGGTATVYLDGVRVGVKKDVTTLPKDIGGGRTTANYIGRSVYSADRYLKGGVRDFSIYNRALSATEVRDLAGDPTAITGVQLDSLAVDPIIDADAGTVTLPVKRGTDLRALRPTIETVSTSSISPQPTGPIDLSSPRTVTVTADGGRSREWTITAIEVKTPILPGFNADPNIVRFGDTYYIYATTDGFDGWSSSTFKTWSSKNLVDWTEHGTILDLGPDVSWADGQAWAPSAIEKNGKYYFYFSANGNIGVAVGDSPTGPFVDSGKPLVARADYGGAQQIDPAVFTDDDGQSYLYWGNGTAYVVPLNDDMTSYDVSRRKTMNGLTDFREGLFMTKRAGTYYLSWSIDDTRSPDYRVGYATGSSPTGPWTSKGEILTKDAKLGILGTGHHSIVQVPGTDDWYIVYHRFGIPGGDGMHRETTIDRLYFRPDGTIEKVVPTLGGVAPLTYNGAAPRATVSKAGADGWHGAGATLTLTGGAGVKRLQYRLGEGPWTDYDKPVTLAAGTYEIGYRAQGDNLLWSDPVSMVVKVRDDAPATGSSPVATAAPEVRGTPRVGSVLRASDGRWNLDGLVLTRTWLRDGVRVKGATGATYRLTAADVGHRIRVRVTASAPGVAAGEAVSARTAVVRKASSRIAARVSDSSIRSGTVVRLRASVLAAGRPARGTVEVRYRGRLVRTLRLKDGKVSGTFRPLRRGAHAFRFTYRGSGSANPSTDVVRVRVR
jgi:hypothetical protein